MVDGLRTVAWINCLLRSPNADALPLFRIGRDGEVLDEDISAKKLRMYRLGRHTPSRWLVEQAEKICPGSCSVLEHVIWSVLRTDRDVPDARKVWIRRLHPEIQRVILRRSAWQTSAGTPWWCLDRTTEGMLELRAGWDALAGLLALTRIAIAEGDYTVASRRSLNVLRMLLIVAPGLRRCGLLLPLFELVVQTVHNKIPVAWLFKEGSDGFVSAADKLLQMEVLAGQRFDAALSFRKRVRISIRLADWMCWSSAGPEVLVWRGYGSSPQANDHAPVVDEAA